MTENEASRPFGMLRFAEQYRAAGALTSVRDDLLNPSYTLIGLSIEIALKAFLASRGYSDEALSRFPFGHDLESLWSHAKERGVRRLVLSGTQDDDLIELLNGHYKRHEFRYIKPGWKSIPRWELIFGLATRLIDGLHDHCYRKAVGREAAALRLRTRKVFDRLRAES